MEYGNQRGKSRGIDDGTERGARRRSKGEEYGHAARGTGLRPGLKFGYEDERGKSVAM